jgi:solute carrier family 35, member E3
MEQVLRNGAIPFFGNLVLALVLVYCNKTLFVEYKWTFPTFLTAFHFAATFVAVRLTLWMQGVQETYPLTIGERLSYGCSLAMAIVFSNLSLMWNSVGFYQLTKLMATPTVAALEYFVLKKPVSLLTAASLVLVIIGIGSTVQQTVSASTMGVFSAVMGIATASYTQIYASFLLQQEWIIKRTPMQIMSESFPFAFLTILVLVPFMDDVTSETGLLYYEWTPGAIAFVLCSSAAAFLSHVTATMMLGAFSALTFQALGHAKTVLILFIGIFIFGDLLTVRLLVGSVLALSGLALYSYSKQVKPPKQGGVTA